MIAFRYFLVALVFASFSSCDDKTYEVGPLFHQISKKDSTNCMNEILDEILEEAKENRRKEVELFSSIDFIPPPCCFCHDNYFVIEISSQEEVKLNKGSDSLSIPENVFLFYTYNRNLTTEEARAVASDSDSPRYGFPLFNRYSLLEIERKIDEATSEWIEVKGTEGADSIIIEYFESKVEEWKKRKWLLEFLDIDELPELGNYIRTDIKYRKTSPKLEEVLNEVALAFYQLRNYYSLLYFHETYLSLYERTKRMNRKIELNKMEAIEVLQAISFYPIDWNDPSPYRLSVPELQEEVR